MSDLFHEEIPFDYISRVFKVMNDGRWHIFQVLTKRSERLAEICYRLTWTGNIWIGVSVESQRYTYRIAALQKVPALVRFLSLEPLLGSIPNLPIEGIHWVIAGGESLGRDLAVLKRIG